MNKYLLVLVGVLLFFTQCSDKENGKYLVGFSQCCNDSWRDAMNEEMERELLFHDEIDLVMEEANGNSEVQIQQIKKLVADGIDLLIVSPNETEPLTGVIRQVYDSGIPVVLIDRKINGDSYTSYIGADNELIGEEAAKYASRILAGSGGVIELYENTNIGPFKERSFGFNRTISTYPDIKVDTARSFEYGVDKFKRLLKRGDYQVVFTHNDRVAKFAYDVVKQMGLEGDVHIIGVDALPDLGVDMVAKGELAATLLYPGGGDMAIRVAADILNGRPVEDYYQLQTLVIDSTNVSAVQLQTKRILEKQEDVEELADRISLLISIFNDQRTLLYLFVGLFILAVFFLGGMIFALNDRNRVNRELKEKNKQIIASNQEAEEANKQKFQFFTNISHEFRTPLTLIVSPVEELLSRNDTGASRQSLLLIRKNIMRLLRLVTQIMDFRKIDSGKMRVQASQSNIVPFVRDIVQVFQKAAENKKITLNFSSSESEITLWYDQTMLDTVVFNLLSNALKFTPSGGKIFVGIEQNILDEEVRLVVEDSGMGMSEEDLHHIFDRFYQGEQNRTLGTGIGLALTKEIVQLHHGTIDVKSVSEKGTRFVIHLKTGKEHFKKEELLGEQMEEHVELESYYAEEFDSIPIDDDQNGRVKDHTILIIEDNNELRNYLAGQLGQFYHLVEAGSVKAGLNKAFEDIPDLIICDLMLGKESGYDVVRTLKSDIKTSHIPIIILSAKASTEEKLRGLRLGVDDYVTKPFIFSLLYERINTLLVNREKLQEHYSSELKINKAEVSESRLDKKFVNEFSAIVEQNIGNQNFGVNDISEAMGLSRVQLYRKVKALIGYSINDYINNVRLKKAAHLIGTSGATISEISHRVGYASPAYFSTAFKSHFGVSPSEFSKGKR